ncbi:hypothetical protein NOVO_08645 [Rickettsiales bacterium Ac37b]|nr:hypothetical protein NOVO_08645 [Rickettsiales bacterium Ac37b]
MAIMREAYKQIMDRIIYCNGHYYTVRTDHYPANMQEYLDKHIQEVREGKYVDPEPSSYTGFKISTSSGTLVVNSTEVSCPENLYLINVYSRFQIEHVITNSTNAFFPEHIKCMNLCFAGVTNENTEINIAFFIRF